MHPVDCPAWEYEDHPRHREILFRTHKALALRLRRNQLNLSACACDSRPVHEELFRELTPLYCEYYAGHYRGEQYRCLREYRVGIPSDNRVGCAPESVLSEMEKWRAVVATFFEQLPVALTRQTPGQLLRYAVATASAFFVSILTLHPYANGNGHAARFIVWAVLGSIGRWPRRFPIEPKPAEPRYSQLVRSYRDGDREPLEMFLLTQLL